VKHKAKFKSIKNVRVLICSKCNIVIKEEEFFTPEEIEASKGNIKIPAQYCDECEERIKYGE